MNNSGKLLLLKQIMLLEDKTVFSTLITVNLLQNALLDTIL